LTKNCGCHVERKGTAAFQTPKPVNCSYGANFKLMLIRHAEETNCLTAAWEILCAVEQNVQCSRKQKVLLLKEQIQPKNHFVDESKIQCH
jgi:hypothetical protein